MVSEQSWQTQSGLLAQALSTFQLDTPSEVRNNIPCQTTRNLSDNRTVCTEDSRHENNLDSTRLSKTGDSPPSSTRLGTSAFNKK